MRTKLATTVTTATLIVLTMGLASAQAPGGSDRGGARSPGGAEAPRGAAERSESNKVSPADTKAPATQPAAQGERRDPSTKSGASDRAPAGTNGRTDDAQRGSRGERDQGVGRDKDAGRDKAGSGRDKGDEKVGEKGPSGDRRDRAGERDDKGTAERTRGERAGNEHGTTRITTEQRSRVKTIFQGHRSEAIHDVHFARRVGTIIPTEYRFRPLPSDIIEFLPEYRGYDYLIVDGEIIILEPGTRRIVDIID